jgi:hypothetical protein
VRNEPGSLALYPCAPFLLPPPERRRRPCEEGKELPDLDAAREQARCNARFTAGETLKERGQLTLSHRIQIEGGNGNVLDTVYFSDVLKIEG